MIPPFMKGRETANSDLRLSAIFSEPVPAPQAIEAVEEFQVPILLKNNDNNDKNNNDMIIEQIPLSSLMKVICEQQETIASLQAVIASQQALLTAKEEQIGTLTGLVASQQQTMGIQEEANRCFWSELKERAGTHPGQDSSVSVVEEIVHQPEPSNAADSGASKEAKHSIDPLR